MGRRNLHLLAHTVCVGLIWDWGVAFEPMKLGISDPSDDCWGLQGKTPTPKQLAEASPQH